MRKPNVAAIHAQVGRQRLAGGLAVAVLATLGMTAVSGAQAETLRVVPSSNITVLDPIWTTAYVTRNFGYMVFDTLFGTDAQGQVKPQMVDTWQTSDDKKTWTFTLREGVAFSDGAAVTSEDVIASLKRWSTRDTLGGLLAQSLDRYEAVDAKTFRMVFKEPFSMVLEALGKPSAIVPFIMPKRIAETSGDSQIKEFIGSGPYVFKADEFRPGQIVVFDKNPAYKPRAEPPSGTTGGKNVYVDRVEWRIIRDPQTQMNALLAGEVDIVEQPAFEQYATFRADKNIKIVDAQPNGFQFSFRFNFLHPPFNNQKVRQAAMLALGQEPMLRTQVGVKDLYKVCKSMFPCGTPFESNETGEYTGVAQMARAKALLAESGYKGEPVVLMRPTDQTTIGKLPLVAKQQLEQAGFKVDMQNMDWASLVSRRARKDAANAGGWSAFVTAWVAEDIQNPLTMAMMNARGDQGWFGWLDDPKLEEIKGRFARAANDAEKKAIAVEAQRHAFEIGTHVPLGQYTVPAAVRSNVNGIVPAGAQVYWNIKKD